MVPRVLTALFLAASLFGLAPQASGAERGKIDVDVVNADIRNVLRLFADVGHVNLVLGDDVGGNVTVRFLNVPWETAMRSVLSVKGLAMEAVAAAIRPTLTKRGSVIVDARTSTIFVTDLRCD